MSETLYSILQLPDFSSIEDVKSEYRKLALKYHPDRNPDESIQVHFKKITEAYNILKNEESKAKYDSTLRSDGFFKQTFNSEQWAGMSYDDIMSDLRGTGFEKAFDNIYGQGDIKGPDAELNVTITLSEAFTGVEKVLYTSQGNIKVNIPAGTGNRKQLRLKGQGSYHPFNSQIPRGDLILTILILPERGIRIVGKDLYKSVKIDLVDYILGKSINIETIGKSYNIKIKPLSDKNLRIKDRGIPADIKNVAGDLYLNIEVILPKTITDEERELYKSLRELKERKHGHE